MIQTTIRIDGMSCSMCEAHINDVIRRLYPKAKKVASSHNKGMASFLSEEQPDIDALRTAISETGYTFLSCESRPYEKKGLFERKE